MIIFLCLLPALSIFPKAEAAVPDEGSHLLLEIGRKDGDCAEFALARDGWNRFREAFGQDPIFIVGRSDPARDWPYVHPGPADNWAGSMKHTFTIYFGVAGKVGTGRCRLVFDLVDTHDRVPPKLRIDVNGRSFGFEETPRGGPDETLYGDPSRAKPHSFSVEFPAAALVDGLNRVAIHNILGSWVLYDRIALETPAAVVLGETPSTLLRAISIPPVLVKRDGVLRQLMRVSIMHHGPDMPVAISRPSLPPVDRELLRGENLFEIPIIAVRVAVESPIEIRSRGGTILSRQLTIEPVRRWEIYLLHHTHLDIGYTHVQSEVEALQWKHLEQALDLADQTAGFPFDARFRWNPEGLWALDGYLKQASAEKGERFFEAVRAGSVGLDALYGNALTGLCRPEELFELTGCARRLARDHGLPIDSAMISDTPGYSWGIVPALAHCGIRYLSIGPNSGHRIGSTLSAWGDRPFYWVSPSGKKKVLCWMAGKGYSWFHGTWRGAATFDFENRDDLGKVLDMGRILDYVGSLEESTYPYDMVQVRYNIGSDNGPPDPYLSLFVKDWNERYAYPRLKITTTSRMFHDFEERYADRIPSVSGDFTPYWEDGAASTARETGMIRAAAERLVQGATLYSLLDPGSYPAEEFHAAWRNVLLYNEHTWGSWNAISDPDSDFARGQWAVKQAYAVDADAQSHDLVDRAVGGIVQRSRELSDSAQVFNTCSWPRTGLVTWPAPVPVPGDRSGQGQTVIGEPYGDVGDLKQRLSSGELIFLARNVPPLSSVLYSLGKPRPVGDDLQPFPPENPPAEVRQTSTIPFLTNGLLTVALDRETGAISELRRKGIRRNLVDRKGGLGLNEYIYVAGRDPAKVRRCTVPPTITVKENGPFVASLLIESRAPGCRNLTREVRLVAGLDHVEIIDIVDKEKVRKKEGVHFAFPFNIPGGEVRVDGAWCVVRPEADQIPGACKNHFTVQRWVDLSNIDYGVTFATLDAPLVEVGAIRADPIVAGWTEHLERSTLIYSYVMNNYWETNYKADQEGPTVFRYAIRPHGRFDAAEAERFGIERSQPLIARSLPQTASAGPGRDGLSPPLFRVEPAGVIMTSLTPSADGAAWIIRLFNAGGRPEKMTLNWDRVTPPSVWLSDPDENKIAPLPVPLDLSAYEIVTIRADRPDH